MPDAHGVIPKIDSLKQPENANAAGSSGMPQTCASSFDDHMNDSSVVFKDAEFGR